MSAKPVFQAASHSYSLPFSFSASAPPPAAASFPYSATPAAVTSDHEFHPPGGRSKRKLVQIVEEVALKYGMKMEVASENWLIKLQLKNDKRSIFGFNLGLNSSSAADFCNDKAATSSSLGSIPHVPHHLFRKPASSPYPQDIHSGVWNKIQEQAGKYGYSVVCKPKGESGGKDVYHTRNPNELQKVVQSLFEKYGDFCMSPFYVIKHEYRLIMLNGKPEIIFRKIRPHLIGDGRSTILQLASSYAAKTKGITLKDLFESTQDLAIEKIPEDGEIIYLTWKHNLCNGATSEFVEIPLTQKEESALKIPLSTTAEVSRKRGSALLQAEAFSNSQMQEPAEDPTLQAAKKRLLKRSEATGVATFEQRPELEDQLALDAVMSVSGGASAAPSSKTTASKETLAQTKSMIKLAKRAAAEINVVFASIDIALLEDGSVKVMEINNGVMMEHLIKQHGEEGFKRAKRVYELAICQLFDIPFRELSLPPRTTRSSPQAKPSSAPNSPPRASLDKAPGSGSSSNRH